MGRIIKFRAWDKENKIMFINNSVCIGIDGSIGFLDIDGVWVEEKDRIELIKFTGLYDTNGNEIYENDIVQINNHKYKIKFEIGSFMLVRLSEETDMYEEFKNCWCDDVYPLCQLHWESNCDENTLYDCEIIGNVYMNPELLEDNNG